MALDGAFVANLRLRETILDEIRGLLFLLWRAERVGKKLERSIILSMQSTLF